VTTPALLVAAKFLAVSERESAHTWPTGEKDDSHWEDCTMCAALMLARICHDPAIPATHAEAEALRHAAGKGPLGGSSTADAVNGLRARYNWIDAFKVLAFDALWADLKPGYAAAAQGGMGAFPAGHSLRRWDPAFDGAHDVLVARVDTQDRVWWVDPLAPQGSYQGQWVSKADLARYVKAFGGSSLVARFTKEAATMALATVTSTSPATIDVLPGSVLLELDGKTVIKTLTGSYKDQFSPYAAGSLRLWTATVSGIVRPVYVKAGPSGLNVRPVVDMTPFTQAQVNAAKAAGEAAGKASGIAAEKSRIGTLLGL
jgi:hypothetical protein